MIGIKYLMIILNSYQNDNIVVINVLRYFKLNRNVNYIGNVPIQMMELIVSIVSFNLII